MPETANRPSMVLQGFGGGVVNNADIALRLARLILERLMAPSKLANLLPLQVQDSGGGWSIRGTGGDDASACRVEIRKLDAAILSLGVQNPPEVLNSTAIVEKFAAILAEEAGDVGELSQQLPFAVIDHGDTWLVRGSRNADRSLEGPGPFHLEVQKRDARVLDMWFEATLHTPPEIKEAVRRKK